MEIKRKHFRTCSSERRAEYIAEAQKMAAFVDLSKYTAYEAYVETWAIARNYRDNRPVEACDLEGAELN